MTTKADVVHKDTCPRPGFRYGATVRRTKDTIARGVAGKVVMVCRGCGASFLA